MRLQNLVKETLVEANKESAQSLIIEATTLRLQIHERIFYDEEHKDDEISKYEKFNARTDRQILRSCVDMYKDFCEKYIPITTNSDYLSIIEERPWIRMVRYASCEDTSYEGRQKFYAIISYAISVYVNFLQDIREDQK